MQSDNDVGLERAGDSQTAALDSHAVRDDVAHLRCNMPFLPIVPFPRVSNVVKPAAGAAIDIPIPDNAVMCKLHGSAGFFVSQNGNANGNDMIASSAAGNPPGSCDVFIASESPWYLVSGKRMLSVFNPNAGIISVGAQFITRDQI